MLLELATQDSNIPQALRGHIAIEEEALWRGAKSDVSRAWLARLAAGDLVGNAWTEPGKGGYDGFQTRLVETPDGPRVTGEKAYTTGSLVADWLDVTARDEGGRELGLIVRRDQPGVSVRDDWPGFGQKTTASGGASLENAIVDAYEVRLLDDRYPYQAAVFQQVLLIVLAGIVAAAARQAGEELRNRKRAYTHGNTARAGDDPQLLQAIGEVDATAALARAQVLETATALDEAFATRGSAREEQREARPGGGPRDREGPGRAARPRARCGEPALRRARRVRHRRGEGAGSLLAQRAHRAQPQPVGLQGPHRRRLARQRHRPGRPVGRGHPRGRQNRRPARRLTDHPSKHTRTPATAPRPPARGAGPTHRKDTSTHDHTDDDALALARGGRRQGARRR